MDMEKIKDTVMNIINEFVAFLDDLINKYLTEIKIDIFN